MNLTFVGVVVFVVFFSIYLATAATWTQNTIDDTQGVSYNIDDSTAVYVVDSTHQHFVYGDSTWHALRYAYNNNGSWTYTSGNYGIIRTTALGGWVETQKGFDVTVEGSVPVIAFSSYGANGDIYVARQDATLDRAGDEAGWTYEEVYSTGVSFVPTVQVDGTGTMHLSFYNTSTQNLIYAYEDAGATDADCANTGWQCEVVASTGFVGYMPRMVLRSADDVPVIVFGDKSNTEVILAIRDGAGAGTCPDNVEWNCYTVDGAVASSSFDEEAEYMGLAENSEGQFAVVYPTDGDDIDYAINTVGDYSSWTSTALKESTGTSEWGGADLTFNQTTPMVCARVQGTLNDLYYYGFDGSVWLNDVVDSTGDTGSFCSIENADTFTMIAYGSDATNYPYYSSATVSYNTAPEVSINSVTEKVDGSGVVDLSVDVTDADSNDVKLKIEYKAGADCSSGTSDPTLSEDGNDISATYGSVSIENDDSYQVGNALGWIQTDSGANTVQFDWSSLVDLPTAVGTYCIKITPNDGTVDGTAQTTTLTLDNVSPIGLSSLSMDSFDLTSADLSWSSVTETNFDHYELWYGDDQDAVQNRYILPAYDTKTQVEALLSLGARDVRVDDIDSDGDQDFVAATVGDGVRWYKNDGSGSFSAFEVDSEAAYSVWVDDMETDGDYDIFVAHDVADKLTWYENNGSESFTAHDIVTGFDFPTVIKAEDIDADGDMDILAGSAGTSNEIAWFENDGTNLIFTKRSLKVETSFVRDAWILDLDSDGDFDFITVFHQDATGSTFAWWENNGSAVFTEHSIIDQTINKVYPADVDEDGDVDIVAANMGTNAVELYVNNGSEIFTPTDILAASLVRSVVVVDLDKDGDNDVLYQAESSSGSIVWGRNDGAESFSKDTLITGVVSENGGFEVADFDGDLINDIVVIGTVSTSPDMTVCLASARSFEWDNVDDVDLATRTTTTTSVSSLEINAEYFYKIWAIDTFGNEQTVTDISYYTLANQVTGFAAVNVTDESNYAISLSWTDNDESGLKIEQDTDCDGYETTVYDNTTVVPSSPYSVTGLNANTCYKFRVSSYNGDGTLNTTSRPESSEITMPPAQPTGLAALAATDTNITWDWDDVVGATDYYIYRSSDDALIGAVGSSTSQFIQSVVVSGGAVLSSNTQYTVYVRAVNAEGSSIGSSTASTYTNASVPTGLSSDAGTQGIDTLKWTWVDGGSNSYYASTSDPVANSGWVTDLFWTQSALTANTSYEVTVKARNEDLVETAGATTSAYTSQITPSLLSEGDVSIDQITVVADDAFNNLAVATSGLYFENTTKGTNSGWIQSSSWTETELEANTTYLYRVKARNGDGDETAFSSTFSTTTLSIRRPVDDPIDDTDTGDEETDAATDDPMAPVLYSPEQGVSLYNEDLVVKGNLNKSYLGVSIYLDGAEVDIVFSDSNGDVSWQSDLTLDLGIHTVYLKTEFGKSETHYFNIEAKVEPTPEKPLLLQPFNGQTISNEELIIAGETYNPNTSLIIYLDGKIFKPVTTDQDGVFSSKVVSYLTEGEHSVYFKTAIGQSDTNTFFIEDPEDPDANLILLTPTKGQFVSNASLLITGSGLAVDQKVDVFVDDVQLALVSLDYQLSFSWKPGFELSEGEHSVYLRSATDKSVVHVFSIVGDEGAKEGIPVIQEPKNNVFVNDGSISIVGKTYFENQPCSIYLDNKRVRDLVSGDDFSFIFSPENVLSDGEHSVYVVTETGVSAVSSFVVDTIRPAEPTVMKMVIITYEQVGDMINTCIAIGGEYFDTDVKSLMIYLDDKIFIDNISLNPDRYNFWNYNFTKDLSIGVHKISVRAIDQANNVSIEAGELFFKITKPNTSDEGEYNPDEDTGGDEGDTIVGDEDNTGGDEGDTTVGDEDNTDGDEGDTTVGDEDNTGGDEGDTTVGDEDNTGGDEGDTTVGDEGDTTVGDEDNTYGDEGDTTVGDEDNSDGDDGGDSSDDILNAINDKNEREKTPEEIELEITLETENLLKNNFVKFINKGLGNVLGWFGVGDAKGVASGAIENFILTGKKIQKKTIDNPVLERINQQSKIPVAIGVTVASVASISTVGATTASGVGLLTYLQFLFTQPLLLFTRRKRRGWGVVYDSVTKRPVDLAIVRVYDLKTNRLVRTKVTDTAGRYEFVLNPGSYRIEAQKKDYAFPSTLLENKENDQDFEGVYYGEEIEVHEKGSVSVPIALDPIRQIAKNKVIKNKYWVKKAQIFFTLFAPIVASISFIISPSWKFAILVVLQLVLYFMFRRLAIGEKPKNWGVIRNSSNDKPLARAVIRVFETRFNKLLETQVTNSQGKYAFLVGNQNYYVTAEKPGYYQKRTEVFNLSSNETGYLTEDINMQAHNLGVAVTKAQKNDKKVTYRTGLGEQEEKIVHGKQKLVRPEGERFTKELPEIDLDEMHEDFYNLDNV